MHVGDNHSQIKSFTHLLGPTLATGLCLLSVVLITSCSPKLIGGTPAATVASSATSTTAAAAAVLPANAALLNWTAPTTHNDGSPLADLTGFKVYYGTASGGPYTTTLNVGLVTTYTVTSLASGTYYFVVTAYDSAGNESVFTTEKSKVIP